MIEPGNGVDEEVGDGGGSVNSKDVVILDSKNT